VKSFQKHSWDALIKRSSITFLTTYARGIITLSVWFPRSFQVRHQQQHTVSQMLSAQWCAPEKS